MKKYYILSLLLAAFQINAQVLITKFPLAAGESKTPDPSAILEIRSKDKGMLLPTVALTSRTDQSTVANPVEGTMVFNTSVYNATTHPNIPTIKPALAIWDGAKWLFTYNKDNVELDLDKVRNYTGDNGTTTATFSSFSAPPSYSFGDLLSSDSGWQVIINSDNWTKKPSFEFDYTAAEQKLIVDVEGIAQINNSGNDGRFQYVVGIFIDNKLAAVKKFYSQSLSGQCTFNKYNVRGIVIEDTSNTILNKSAGQTYNIKIAVRAMPVPNNNYNRLAFGTAATGGSYNCSNINTDTARSYANVLTIERKNP